MTHNLHANYLIREMSEADLCFAAACTAKEGWLSDVELDAIDREVLDAIDAAVGKAKAAPPPDESEVTTDVYISY